MTLPSKRIPCGYKDAILYELHVRAFRDSDGDGMGDFRGLIEKLDYLQDLGVTASVATPLYASPCGTMATTVADYTDVQPSYGTLDDCKRLLQEAHGGGYGSLPSSSSITPPTSIRGSAAQRAKPGSPWRDFYVWSESQKSIGRPDHLPGLRVLQLGVGPRGPSVLLAPVFRAPAELNYTNPRVRQAILRVIDYWFRLGVDGLRLDAVPISTNRRHNL
jgi:maltose alpha-D-glucosyltransferase/alpha-amylase